MGIAAFIYFSINQDSPGSGERGWGHLRSQEILQTKGCVRQDDRDDEDDGGGGDQYAGTFCSGRGILKRRRKRRLTILLILLPKSSKDFIRFAFRFNKRKSVLRVPLFILSPYFLT